MNLSSYFLSPFLFLFLFHVSVMAEGYDMNMGNITLWHSENAYCDPETYTTRQNKGVLASFVATFHIQGKHDTEGYIGYTESQQSIFVSFRGSSDIQNWVTNLDVTTTKYPLCDDCKVHSGFYSAEQSVIASVIDEVKQLKAKYPSYTVVVTGHSLGAALATLASLDLLAAGISPLRLFNYGSPRVGDTSFATYASEKLTDRNRVTHHKDMVVHVPMHERFTHISSEWYEADDTVTVVPCSGFEDKNCAYQWSITSIDDHLWYMGVVLGSSGCSEIL